MVAAGEFPLLKILLPDRIEFLRGFVQRRVQGRIGSFADAVGMVGIFISVW